MKKDGIKKLFLYLTGFFCGMSVMAIELGASMPWYKYASYVKGINEYGKSMPIKYIFDEYGFTVDKICNEFLENVR